MCGIAGYSGRVRIDDERIDRTLALMRRRGPDARGHRHFSPAPDRHVHLLHSRLSIIDLDERASQPFHVGTRWMVYNGELYNYIEVKRQLDAVFVTTSDTEVLLRAIDADRDPLALGTLDRCEGMWAFAVYDEDDDSLLLSRDRFGEKPLYLCRTDDGFYFGSEVKFIAALAGVRLKPNLDQLRRYLVNGYKALYKQPRTFFEGVEELPAATVARVGRDGAIQPRRYWTPTLATDERMSYDDAVAGTRDRLIRSVELRLRSDVPLAFCMSGGVDSNALISIAKRRLGHDVHGFTIANTDARYEESALVAHAVEALGLRHTSIPTDPTQFLVRLRELVRQHDAPVYTITYYAHWLLQRSIHEHGYKISISGTAADELFTGYYDHHLAYLAAVRDDPALHGAALRGWNQYVRPEVRNPFLSNPQLFVADTGFRDHIFLDAEKFAGFLNYPWREQFAETRYSDDLLRNRMANELFHEAVPVILHEDDLNAMYFSIENRSPFLDRALCEHAYSIPSRHLVRNGFAKVVLRDAMRGIVPDVILDSRRKVGFNAPIFDFLKVDDRDVRAQLLDDSPIFEEIDKSRIETLLDKAQLPNSESKFLFYFLCAKLFLEEAAS
jgi:asparagine synthase (glutamine-hydrolysing)